MANQNTTPLRFRIEKLTVGWNDRKLISDFDLDLEQGKFCCVLGPSGCGKSTLLRSLAGLLPARDGRIEFADKTPDQIGWPEYRRQVVYVHQKPHMFEGTVRDNLERALKYRANTRSVSTQQMEELLESLFLPHDLLNHPARSLSVGQQQRISIIRGLMVVPSVLLLDEPTSALDERAAGAVLELLKKERTARALSAIIATHESGRLSNACDHMIDLTRPGPSDRTSTG